MSEPRVRSVMGGVILEKASVCVWVEGFQTYEVVLTPAQARRLARRLDRAATAAEETTAAGEDDSK